MSSPADTTGRSPTEDRYYDKGWHDSPERAAAKFEWYDGPEDCSFENSTYFRNARLAYRKRVNRSWNKEST